MQLSGFLRRGGAPPHRGYHLVATDEALLMSDLWVTIPGALPDRSGSERQDLRAIGSSGLKPSEAESQERPGLATPCDNLQI